MFVEGVFVSQLCVCVYVCVCMYVCIMVRVLRGEIEQGRFHG